MNSASHPNNACIGRFAPSPSGPLHFGSLAAALASYLDARHQGGQWLVRIDDIDPPREVPGAASTILRQLEGHGLQWDGQVLYQSSRADAYREALQQLDVYPCDCSRRAVRAMAGTCNGNCRRRQLPPAGDYALRLRVDSASEVTFNDLIQGPQRWPVKANGNDDFIVRRRDGLIAYQLACAVDDLYQNITDVIRGGDLLDSTPRQLYLRQRLAPATRAPRYGHIPLVLGDNGQKLSKQNLAAAVNPAQATENMVTALCWLRCTPPGELRKAPAGELLAWAVTHWRRDKAPQAAGGIHPGYSA